MPTYHPIMASANPRWCENPLSHPPLRECLPASQPAGAPCAPPRLGPSQISNLKYEIPFPELEAPARDPSSLITHHS
jgi:hypothetical protein